MAASLHSSVAQTGWLIAALYLTSSVAQPTLGRLSDLFGPRRVFLISLFFVAAAGTLGHFATSFFGLLFVRILLGVGTSGAYPSAMCIFREQADRHGAEIPRVAMGILTSAAIATTAVGPLIGGLLTASFGWHSIFTINVPLALFTLVMAVVWVPKDVPRTISFKQLVEEVDLTGIGLFSIFLLSLMLFLMNLKDQPYWLALALAVCFCGLLVFHSLRRKQPFIDVRMLARNRALTLTYLRVGIVMVITYSVFYGFAQWLESAVGLSTAAAGLVTLPMSAVAMISSLTGVHSKGLRAPFLISIGAQLVGCIALCLIDSHTSIWLIAGAVIFFGVVPTGTFSTATQAAIYILAPAEEIGTAAGLQRTAAYIGAMSAASLLAFVYGQHATDHGLHSLGIIMGVTTAALFVATLFDRSIPKVPLTAPRSGVSTTTS